MKNNRLLSNFFFILSLISFLALGQRLITQVAAQVNLYTTVLEEHLDFGVVFPEEGLFKNFHIDFSGKTDTKVEFYYEEDKDVGEEYEEEIKITHGRLKYGIAKDRKLIPAGLDVEDDPSKPGYYRNLCPHLDSFSEDGEGDSFSASFLGPDDNKDSWRLDFTVPPIEGYVPQGEAGILTVPVTGDYGCDLRITELPHTATLEADLDINCVNFVPPADPEEDSYDSSTGVISWAFDDVYYGQNFEVDIKVKAINDCDGAVTVIEYDDGVTKTREDGVEDLHDKRSRVAGAVYDPGILGAATGANQIYFVLGSLAMMATGFYLRRRTSPASSKEIA